MARMPGARWRPISRNYTARRTTKTRVILHTTASAVATSMFGWFNTRGANASSHFHVDFAGNIEQYIDTDFISWANRDGNSDSVTVETQGAGHEQWTGAQIKAIVRIIQWSRGVHPQIPLRQMTSSASSQRGIGWHRLGVNGNFPTSGILRGRQQRGGGELWSSARGKVCPGTARIQQIPAIIRQANGHGTPAVNTASTAAPTPAPKYERRRTNQDNVPIRSHRNYRDDDNIVGYASTKGYRLNVVEDPPGGYTRVRWQVDGEYGNYWVATEHLEDKPAPKAATKPAASSSGGGKEYPHVALPVTDSHTTASHNAWVYLMRYAVNRTDRNLTINIQRWLRDLGYYKGTVDGQFGPRTVRALQRFLQYKGLYKGVVDGDRGAMTIRAEIQYLNDQAKYLV